MASFQDVVYDALKKQRDARPSRNYFGASRWGENCLRKMAYEWHKVPTDPSGGFSGRAYAIFDQGHDAETRIAEYMKIAGFELLTVKPDGEQYGFKDANGKLSGHCDGIIVSGPVWDYRAEPPIYPALWECKGLNNKNWRKVVNNGIREEKPVYWTQVHTYMNYFELPSCIFTSFNKDTAEIHEEVIYFSEQEAERGLDRAIQTLQSASPEDMPRRSNNPADWDCKYCDYRFRCHGLNADGVKEIPDLFSPEASLPGWMKKFKK